ncbi:MAG: hypothetical protein QOH05_4447 [Acetobacteraceae bacterium]|nr:hypothetical protein [Acetobacteraceae bacterium]
MVGSTRDEALFRTIDTRYGRLIVFANDTGAITQSLQRYGEWAENELNFLHAMIDEGAHVLDVGAYIGTHTLAFSRFVGPAGRVISIEPQLPTFRLLTANVEANGLNNVVLKNAIASVEAGAVAIPSLLIDHPDSFGSASLLAVMANGDHESRGSTPDPVVQDATVAAITIDSIDLAECALIKIDAEGMEELVLRGAQLTLSRCRPIIYAECNSLEAGLKTLKVLREAGYGVMAHVVCAFNPDNFRSIQDNIFDSAREVALVGFPEATRARIQRAPLRPGELLLDIDTVDDLVLALLNKPQYAPEILRVGAAARSGGARCLDEADAHRFEAERLLNDTVVLRDALAVQQQVGDALRAQKQLTDALEAQKQVSDALLGNALEAQKQLNDALDAEKRANEQKLAIEVQRATAARDELKRVRQTLEAKNEACMRQAGLARSEADRLHREHQMLQNEAAQAIVVHEGLRAEAAQALVVHERLRAEAAASARALALVQASTTWRMTAPVRMVMDLFKRRRR